MKNIKMRNIVVENTKSIKKKKNMKEEITF